MASEKKKIYNNFFCKELKQKINQGKAFHEGLDLPQCHFSYSWLWIEKWVTLYAYVGILKRHFAYLLWITEVNDLGDTARVDRRNHIAWRGLQIQLEWLENTCKAHWISRNGYRNSRRKQMMTMIIIIKWSCWWWKDDNNMNIKTIIIITLTK